MKLMAYPVPDTFDAYYGVIGSVGVLHRLGPYGNLLCRPDTEPHLYVHMEDRDMGRHCKRCRQLGRVPDCAEGGRQ